MKNRTLAATLLILLLVTIACFMGLSSIGGTGHSTTRQERDQLGTASHQSLANDGQNHLRHQGDNSRGLKRDIEPEATNRFSSKVSAEIQEGETLVMGGYRTPDGNYEFTMLTPSFVTMEDGSQAILVKSKAMSVSPEFARNNGMDTLTTAYPNADQHAEAWGQGDLRATLLAAGKAEGVDLLSAPRVTTSPGQPVHIQIGSGEGPGYSIVATISKSPNGGFSMQSHVSRNTGNSPSPPP